MRFGPELSRRLEAADKRKRKITEEGEMYFEATGEYRQPSYKGEVIPSKPDLFELYGIERSLFFTLIQIASLNRDQNLKRPTIMLDVGGMAGISMVRIALQPAVRGKIEHGEIIIAVSNLGFDIKKELAKPRPADRLSFLPVPETLLVAGNHHLVRYIIGDATTLMHTTVATADGQNVLLKGNVDLVHEKMALAHGKKNDLDIPRLGKLVSPNGQLWLGTSAKELMTALDPSDRDDNDIYQARQSAHLLGVENLAELDLKPVTHSDRSYQIFQH